jgi:hypothetical protein
LLLGSEVDGVLSEIDWGGLGALQGNAAEKEQREGWYFHTA